MTALHRQPGLELALVEELIDRAAANLLAFVVLKRDPSVIVRGMYASLSPRMSSSEP
jgi:hypothetical protein